MTEIGLGHYLSLGAIIFFLGVIGIFLNRKNVIVILMSIELILFGSKYQFDIIFYFFWRHSRSNFHNVNFNCCCSGGSNRSCYYCSLLQKQRFY